MKKTIAIIMFGFIFTVLISGCLKQNSEDGTKDKEVSDSGVNFILSYGIIGKNILNTNDNSYTKKLEAGVTITKTLKLTEKEKKSLLEDMIKMDIFSFPNSFKEYCGLTPCESYRLEIDYSGRKKTLNWSVNNIPFKRFNTDEKDPKKDVGYIETDETKNILALMRLEARIEKYIEEKPAYKELRKAIGDHQID